MIFMIVQKQWEKKCGVDECCGKNCHTEFFLKNGQCPPGTRPRSKYDFHTPPRGTYDAEECCREPSKCEEGIKAPAGTTHTCDDAPTFVKKRSLICGNGCYSECWRLGQSYEHKQGTVEMFCASTGYTADTVCDGFVLCPAHLHPRISAIVRMTNAAGLQPYSRMANVFHHTTICVKMEIT